MKSSNKKNTKSIKSSSSLNKKLKTNNIHPKLKLDNIYLNSEKYNTNIAKENQRNTENICTKNRYDTKENVNYNTEIKKGYKQAHTECNTPYSQQKAYENKKIQNQISQNFLTASKTYNIRNILITTNKRDNQRNNNIHNNFIINGNYGININKIKIINNSNTNIYGNNNFSFVINDIKNIKNSINKKNNDNDNIIDSSKRCYTSNNDFSNPQINCICKSNLINSIDNSDFKNNQKTYNIVNINNNINNNYINNIQNIRNNNNYIKSESNNNFNKIRNSANNIFINIKSPINNNSKKEENYKIITIKRNNNFNNSQNKNKININLNNNKKLNNNLKFNKTIDTEYINNINYIYSNNLKKENNNKLINNNSSNYISTTINSHMNRKQNNINLINSFNNSNNENNIHNKRNLNKIKISNQTSFRQGNYKEIKDRSKKYRQKLLLKESNQFSKNDMKSYLSFKLNENNNKNIRENSCKNSESKNRSREDKFIFQYNAPKENKNHERIVNTPNYSENKRFLLNKSEIKNYQTASNKNFLSIIISNNQKSLITQKSEDNLRCIIQRNNSKEKPECLSVNNIFSKNTANTDKVNRQLKDNICQSTKKSNRYYNFTNRFININNNLSERKNRYTNSESHSIKIKDNRISQVNANNKLNKTPDHNIKINENCIKNLNQNISCKELNHKNLNQKNNIKKESINTIGSTNTINNIQTIKDSKDTIHKINEKIIVNNIYNNILYRSIRISSINKKTKDKKQELLNELSRCINFGKSLLNKIPKKECDICHKFIDSHLFKIHYNSHPTEIFNWLYLGTFSNACDIKELRRLKVNYVLNVANECINKKLPKDIKELHLKIKDFDEFELYNYFDEANEFINKCKEEGNVLLVHCKLGISRSASFIIAYLIKFNKMSAKEALEFVKEKRNQVRPNEGFINQLEEYEKRNKK